MTTQLLFMPSFNTVLSLHEQLVAVFAEEDDPISPSGPRDIGLLDSSVHRPNTSYLGTEKYTTLAAKAAALFHSLVKNHPFHQRFRA